MELQSQDLFPTYSDVFMLSLIGNQSLNHAEIINVMGTAAVCKSPLCLLSHHPMKVQPPAVMMTCHIKTMRSQGRSSTYKPHMSSLPSTCRLTGKRFYLLGIRSIASLRPQGFARCVLKRRRNSCGEMGGSSCGPGGLGLCWYISSTGKSRQTLASSLA